MGREVRRVTADWEPHTQPLHDGIKYEEAVRAWEEAKALWDQGLLYDGKSKSPEYEKISFEEYYGARPDPKDYTKTRPGDALTHIVLYENTSEGTPLSPKFPLGEEEALAKWLADNKTSAFGNMTASYEGWLAMIRQGSSLGAVASSHAGLISGVEACKVFRNSSSE
jgi:hypothetical protein